MTGPTDVTGDGDYVIDGIYADIDNHPAESDGYNARRFGDPEWTPVETLVSGLDGNQTNDVFAAFGEREDIENELEEA